MTKQFKDNVSPGRDNVIVQSFLQSHAKVEFIRLQCRQASVSN